MCDESHKRSCPDQVAAVELSWHGGEAESVTSETIVALTICENSVPLLQSQNYTELWKSMSDNLQNVVAALDAVYTSHDRGEAEAYLTHAEINLPGYYSMLLHIYTNPGYNRLVQSLASITFKNGVDKYWRKSAKQYEVPIFAKNPRS